MVVPSIFFIILLKKLPTLVLKGQSIERGYDGTTARMIASLDSLARSGSGCAMSQPVLFFAKFVDGGQPSVTETSAFELLASAQTTRQRSDPAVVRN